MDSAKNTTADRVSNWLSQQSLSGEKSLENYRGRVAERLKPITEMLQKYNITPNAVTLTALGGSVIYALLLLLFSSSVILWLGLIVWIAIKIILDVLAGTLTPPAGSDSKKGVALSEFSTIISEAVLIIPFVCLPGTSGFVLAVFAWLALASEFASVLRVRLGNEYKTTGPMGKADRGALMMVAALFAALAATAGSVGGVLVTILFGLACLLAALTVFNRVKEFFCSDIAKVEQKAASAVSSTQKAVSSAEKKISSEIKEIKS